MATTKNYIDLHLTSPRLKPIDGTLTPGALTVFFGGDGSKSVGLSWTYVQGTSWADTIFIAWKADATAMPAPASITTDAEGIVTGYDATGYLTFDMEKQEHQQEILHEFYTRVSIAVGRRLPDGRVQIATLLSPVDWVIEPSTPVFTGTVTGGSTGAPFREWVRPADWLILPTVTETDRTFVGNWAVFPSGDNTCALRAAGDYTVDWGDGTTTNHTSETDATHTYTYSSISSTTESSRGYRQVIITVTPQAGQTLHRMIANTKDATLRGAWLELKVSLEPVDQRGDSTPFNNKSRFFRALAWQPWDRLLENVEIYGNIYVDNMANMFAGCYSLYKCSIDNTENCKVFYSMFSETSLLKEPGFSYASATDIDSMFILSAVQNAPVFNWDAVDYYSNIFFNASALRELPALRIKSPTADGYLEGIFSGCVSATSAKELVVEPTAAFEYTGSYGGYIGTLYDKCTSLQIGPAIDLGDLDTNSVTYISELFTGNTAMWKVPDFSIPNTVQGCYAMFAGCSLLEKNPLLNIPSSCVDLYQTWYGCNAMKDMGALQGSPSSFISLPASLTDLGQAFYQCNNLTNLPFWDMQYVTDITGIFQGARVKEIPAYNFSAVTTADIYSLGAYNHSIQRSQAYGMTVSHSYYFNRLSATAIDEIFTNLGTVISGASINVASNPGSATCTPSIATTKGWTVHQ